MHAKPRYTGRHRRPSRLHLLIAGPVVALALTLAGCGGADVEPQEPAQADEQTSEQDAPEPEDSPTPEDTYEAPEPQHESGTGSAVVEIDQAWVSEPGLVSATHSGESNFAIHTVDADGNEQDLLVNTIGSYDGTRLFNEFDGASVAALQIDADGAWEITIEPPGAATEWSGSKVSGSGDDVVSLGSKVDGMATITATHSGSSNFAVHSIGDTKELLFNEIGSFEGETLLPSGTVAVEVQADGDWALEK